MTLALSGATGFVGRALAHRLAVAEARPVRLLLRSPGAGLPARAETHVVGDLASADLGPALQGCTAIIHAAARVHVMHERARQPIEAYRHANVAGTMALARQAVRAGVRRFIYLSSIKVHGEQTAPGHAFHPDDSLAPQDDYARSKAEAETQLRALAQAGGLELVVVRPPLVYGPGVRANFARLVQAVDWGLPLPLAGVDNRRSLVALDNLVDLLVRCVDHPGAAGRAFLVSDGEDLSTAELVRRLAAALQRPPRLWRVPPAWLRAAGMVTGRSAAVDRLCGNLQADIGPTRSMLDWTPPVGVDEALRRMVRP